MLVPQNINVYKGFIPDCLEGTPSGFSKGIFGIFTNKRETAWKGKESA